MIDDQDILVTAAHLRSVPVSPGRTGLCARGARQFCQRHGIDWAAFVREGVPAGTLLATGDALAAQLVAHARHCAEGVDRG